LLHRIYLRRLAALSAAAVLITTGLVTDGATGKRVRTYAPKDCTKPQVKPNRIVFACADAGLYANHLRWKQWRHRRARGKGVLHANTCRPDCAAHNFKSYRVNINLRKVKRGRCGGRYLPLFRKAILNFPDEKPGYARRIHKTRLFCNP
jgi:hypothetical protein